MHFKKNNFVKKFLRKNNQDHENFVRIVAGGHNRSDSEFLKGNKAVMQKLQQQNGWKVLTFWTKFDSIDNTEGEIYEQN